MNESHPALERLLSAAMDGEGAEREQIRRHLARCAECRAAAAEFERLRNALRVWGTAEPSERFNGRLMARIAEHERNRRVSLHFFSWTQGTGRRAAAFALAALAAAAVLTAKALQPVRESPPASRPQAAETVKSFQGPYGFSQADEGEGTGLPSASFGPAEPAVIAAMRAQPPGSSVFMAPFPGIMESGEGAP